MSGRQLPLPLALPPERGAPVISDRSNAVARTWLAAPDDWPNGRLALFGPEGVGKSLLLRQGGGERRGRGVRPGPSGILGDAHLSISSSALVCRKLIAEMVATIRKITIDRAEARPKSRPTPEKAVL